MRRWRPSGAQQAKEEIDQWIAEVQANEDDPSKLGLAAFAQKNFRKAGQLFTRSAEQKTHRLTEVRKAEDVLIEEIVRDFRLAGDSHANSYLFDQALEAYANALRHVTKEYKPRLWAATLNDIGNAHGQRGIRVAGPALHDHLTAAIQAYRQALEVYTRPALPQDWAMTQNNLGAALAEQGTRTSGERGTQLLAEAVTTYRQALEMRTAEALPMGWEQTQRNLAKALLVLEDWSQAVTSYMHVLHMNPDDRKAYEAASGLYHEKLFQFPEAFAVEQQWLERHPDDLSALSDFAEKHFTTGRFAECAQRLAALLARPDMPPTVAMALRALEVATLLALEHTHLIPGKIATLQEQLLQQPETFTVTWSFAGTLHFIHQHDTLAPYRAWLSQWFRAFAAPDRQSIVTGLDAARGSFLAGIK